MPTHRRRDTVIQQNPQQSGADSDGRDGTHGNRRMKVQFYAAPQTVEELRLLAQERDVSVAELLRQSIRLYKMVLDSQRQGKALCFRSNEGVLSEVSVP